MSIYSHSNVIGLSWNSPPDGKCEIHDYLRLKCPTKLTPPAPLTIMSQDWTVDKAKQQLSTLFVAATQSHFYCEASVHNLITWSTSAVFFVSFSTSISSANMGRHMYNFNQSNFEINFQKVLGSFRTCLPFVDFLPTTVPPSNVVWPSQFKINGMRFNVFPNFTG